MKPQGYKEMTYLELKEHLKVLKSEYKKLADGKFKDDRKRHIWRVEKMIRDYERLRNVRD